MSHAPRHEALIHTLGAGLVPVRRLPPPWLRTLGWLAVVAALALGLLWRYGTGIAMERWRASPDMAWATAGAVLTAISAAWAAFASGMPGRKAVWAWLPVPPALLWIGASGLGCLRTWVEPAAQLTRAHPAPDCLVFILAFSIPLSALLIWLLRRACPLRPVLTAVLIGLASAAASASLLEICHAYGAAATDLLTHAAAVAVVVAANAAMGGRLLSRR
jgi:hypothetical protein